MPERRRGNNGAAKRYKGERELIATRVPPAWVDELDESRNKVGATRNDWLAAALLVGLERPDDVAAALGKVARPQHAQLAFDSDQEVLDRSA